MNTHNFHREYEKVPKELKFQPIDTPAEHTSLFVIFKRLEYWRAQKRHCEEQEKHLLGLAEIGFKQFSNNDGNSNTT